MFESIAYVGIERYRNRSAKCSCLCRQDQQSGDLVRGFSFSASPAVNYNTAALLFRLTCCLLLVCLFLSVVIVIHFSFFASFFAILSFSATILQLMVSFFAIVWTSNQPYVVFLLLLLFTIQWLVCGYVRLTGSTMSMCLTC